MPRPAEIKSAVQLLVEGNDQRNFFEAFTSHLSIANVQIQNFGGVSELSDFLEGFVGATGFREIVQSLGIVRDAEMWRSVPKRSVGTEQCLTARAGQSRRTH